MDCGLVWRVHVCSSQATRNVYYSRSNQSRYAVYIYVHDNNHYIPSKGLHINKLEMWNTTTRH